MKGQLGLEASAGRFCATSCAAASYLCWPGSPSPGSSSYSTKMMLFHLAHTAIEILPVASPVSQSLVWKQLYETQEEEEASEGTGVNFRNLHKMSAGDWERVGSGT